MNTLNNLRSELKQNSDIEKAEIYRKFFKTGKGEYGEGDIFLGLSVPQTRGIAKKYKDISILEISKLLDSKIHEERLAALEILNMKYESKNISEKQKEEIFNFYLAHTKWINNWDLVDLSAEYIVGDFLFEKDKSILYKLAKSSNLWERRISIISTFNFIKGGKFDDTLAIAEILMKDNHDLIQKAVGWMLRELGKRDKKVEEQFLKKNYKIMPRTTLRYAIEKFPEKERKMYLLGLI